MYILSEKNIRNIQKFFVNPFKNDLAFFILIFSISAIVDFVVYTYTASILKAIFIVLHHYIICYFLTLFLCILPKCIKVIYKVLILILVNLNFIIDFVCIYSFHSVFSESFTSIFANTNINEILEFLKTYITPFHLLVFVSFWVGISLFYRRILKQSTIVLDDRMSLIGVVSVFVGILFIGFISTKNIENVSIIKFYSMFKDAAPDLKKYMSNPKLEISKQRRPQNIVIIIGESFAKSHCSLYGYEKNTNPHLALLRDSGLLYIFNNVVSPALNTVPAFKCIMSSYRSEDKDNVDWFRCVTLHEVLHLAGYETYWFSNQNKNGLWDNVVTQYAQLSNHVYFNGEKFAVRNKSDLDGDLVSLIKEHGQLDSVNKSRVYFIHLMGSHYDFNRRFPENFRIFREKDYIDKLESQRKSLADYDNSVLYNDFVVDELIKLFDKKESIVIYFPDHGLDMYESHNDYCGHAMYNNEVSAKAGSAIPFVIYMNVAFQKSFPEISQRVSENGEVPFCTDNLIYTIMHILGIKFCDNNDVENYSLLS